MAMIAITTSSSISVKPRRRGWGRAVVIVGVSKCLLEGGRCPAFCGRLPASASGRRSFFFFFFFSPPFDFCGRRGAGRGCGRPCRGPGSSIFLALQPEISRVATGRAPTLLRSRRGGRSSSRSSSRASFEAGGPSARAPAVDRPNQNLGRIPSVDMRRRPDDSPRRCWNAAGRASKLYSPDTQLSRPGRRLRPTTRLPRGPPAMRRTLINIFKLDCVQLAGTILACSEAGRAPRRRAEADPGRPRALGERHYAGHMSGRSSAA